MVDVGGVEPPKLRLDEVDCLERAGEVGKEVKGDEDTSKSDPLVCLVELSRSSAPAVPIRGEVVLGDGELLNRGELVVEEDAPFNNRPLLFERFSRIRFSRSLNEPITIPFDRGESDTFGLDEAVDCGGVVWGGFCSSCLAPPATVGLADTS